MTSSFGLIQSPNIPRTYTRYCKPCKTTNSIAIRRKQNSTALKSSSSVTAYQILVLKPMRGRLSEYINGQNPHQQNMSEASSVLYAILPPFYLPLPATLPSSTP